MKSHIAVALRVTVATLILTGVRYPLAVTGLAQVVFPSQANGSLIGPHITPEAARWQVPRVAVARHAPPPMPAADKPDGQ